jgi:hypothetical protein
VKRILTLPVLLLVTLVALSLPVLPGLALAAQAAEPAVELALPSPEVDVLQPATWYESQQSVFAAAAIIATWIVKLSTALGKEWFRTHGQETVYLSLGISVVLAGVGGYLALGYLAGAGGLLGALQAAVLALLSWLGANASAKYDRQAHASAVERANRQRTQTNLL